MSVPARRALVKEWLTLHRADPIEDLLEVVAELLTEGGTYEEQTCGGEILRMRRDVRRLVRPDQLEAWLDRQVGWAEVDSLCQSTFPADQILGDWPEWKGLLLRLSESDNINKRRSSLVLLTGPVAHSDDPRLAELALTITDRLAPERKILITKAVSWLLRSLVKRHREEVVRYLDDRRAVLPPIAVRETTVLLTTGTKRGSPRPR